MKTPLGTMCLGGLLQKDENQEWKLFEDLAEKTIQWEPTPDKFRNSNPISSKGSLHSIESSIPIDDKIACLIRWLEALETKELALVNKVSPGQVPISGCIYCQAMNYLFEECLVFLTQ